MDDLNLEGLSVDPIALTIYSVACVLWLPTWRYIVGFKVLREQRLMLLPFLGAFFVLGMNILLALNTSIPSHDKELLLYPYVESNATTVAGLALAISIFVVIIFEKDVRALSERTAKKFLQLVFWSFLFSLMGCLPLYWMPPEFLWLTVLRHLKTVPFTFGLFLLAAAMVVFIYETRTQTLSKTDPH